MIVSEKHNIIILNPPKTGTWFRQKLLGVTPISRWKKSKIQLGFERKGLRHQTLKQLALGASSVLNKDLASYKILTFCRNPWERAASWLQMLKKYKNKEYNMNEVFRRLDWAKQEYYCEYNGLKADFIIKCSEQNQNIYTILKDLGITLDSEFAQVAEKRIAKYDNPKEKLNKYKKFFENPDCIDKIGELEKYIIDLKGYTFDL